MSVPEISVLVPARNEELLIERAIRSVLDGEFENVEIVVVLDNCTDRTENVVGAISDPRVRCIVNEGQPGIGPARNLGVSAARAPLIACLDADDIQERRRLTRQLQYMRNNSLDVCAGWARLVDGSGREIHLQVTPSASNDVRRALKRGNVIANSSVLMKRDVLLACGGYRRTRWEDYDLWVRMSAVGVRFGCLPEVVVIRELRANSVWSRRGPTLLGRLHTVRHRFRAARAMGGLAPW